jgi:hypothetical protein
VPESAGGQTRRAQYQPHYENVQPAAPLAETLARLKAISEARLISRRAPAGAGATDAAKACILFYSTHVRSHAMPCPPGTDARSPPAMQCNAARDCDSAAKGFAQRPA